MRQKLGSSEDVAALRQVTNDLLQAMQGIGAAMYAGDRQRRRRDGGEPAAGAPARPDPRPKKPDDVVDGEFKEAEVHDGRRPGQGRHRNQQALQRR